jgi:hypothetical protein
MIAAMSTSGAVTLGQIERRVAVLEIACRKCERYGRYRVGRLIKEHGREMTLPTLRDIIAGDCPRQRAASVYDQCGVYYPQLPAIASGLSS